MSFFNSMNVSATGMTAQRLRMDTISQNLANIDTTRTEKGGPYRRKIVRFQEIGTKSTFSNILGGYTNMTDGGVRVTSIEEDKAPFITKYDPTHPDADKDGYVKLPNVNNIEEMTNLISANRSYEANITAFNATKSMLMASLSIGRG